MSEQMVADARRFAQSRFTMEQFAEARRALDELEVEPAQRDPLIDAAMVLARSTGSRDLCAEIRAIVALAKTARQQVEEQGDE